MSRGRSTCARWLLGGALVLVATPGCGDRACLIVDADAQSCPSREAALDKLAGDCQSTPVVAVTSDGELEDGACCYDVDTLDEDGLAPCAIPPPTPGPGGGSSTGGTGAVGGGGAGGSGGGGGLEWSCLGKVSPDSPVTGSATVAVSVAELGAQAGIEGALVSACSADSVTCAAPFASALTDGSGVATLAVPTDVVVYYEVFAPLGLVPLLHHEPLLPDPGVSSVFASPVSQEVLDGWLGSMGMTENPDRGHVIVTDTLNCLGNTTGGVQLDIAGAAFVYLADGLPHPELTEAPEGRGVALNVPAGATTVVARVASTLEIVGELPVNVRPGTVTSVRARPMP